ncbi:hypothetical protein FQN54_001295 [Arachnomyces sp. PD_36]|nr:hypothetical protein FQN54_001295 [Arachnomyces sp. PD_36]
MVNNKHVIAAFGLASCALANNPIADSKFRDDPIGAATDAAPLWFLPSGTCFPSSATNEDGSQNGGNDPDNCNIFKLDNNCPAQPDWTGEYTKAHDFPTYALVRKCDDINEWRILYDVYFTKDTGHKNDWEWAIVTFVPSDNGTYVRDSVIMENEGDHGFSTWADLPYTYDSDIHEDAQDKDHAKLFISKWHHSVHTTDHTDTFKDTCPPSGNVDFRNNDYYYASGDWLIDGHNIPADWDWGSADSSPMAFDEGGYYDICNIE